jgi:hypothetical protein
MKKSIEIFLKEKSSIASNRLVKVKNRENENFRQFIPARYLEENKTELFKQFPLSEEIS